MNFYLRAPTHYSVPTPPLPDGYRAEMWRPKLWTFAPSCLFRKLDDQRLLKRLHLAFFWLHYYSHHLFHRNIYRILLIFRGEDLAHYSVLRTRDYRFPFMHSDDVQIGPVWTHPLHRRNGLATFALLHLVSSDDMVRRYIWWLCLRENSTSNVLASEAGFSLVYSGTRVKRWGSRTIGYFAPLYSFYNSCGRNSSNDHETRRIHNL